MCTCNTWVVLYIIEMDKSSGIVLIGESTILFKTLFALTTQELYVMHTDTKCSMAVRFSPTAFLQLTSAALATHAKQYSA